MKIRPESILLAPCAVCLCFLAGCMVGPDYERPETIAETAGSYVRTGQHMQDVNDPNALNRWWEEFGDAATAELVREALANNNDLKAAAARVLQAEAVLAETHGRRLPDVSYDISRMRNKQSFNLGGGPFGGGRFTVMSTTWAQNISVSYVLDFFGKLKRAERAAWSDMLAAQAMEQSLVNATVAMVISARIEIATLQRRLAIAKANIESRQNTLNIVEQRYQRGLVGPVDVRLARENLETSMAEKPSIELSLAKAHNALDVLLGRQPAASPALPQTLPDLPDLKPVPIGVPAALLDRRPDVIAAEFSLRSSSELIGVSIAQLYPDFTLTAAWGASADRWRDIWEHFAETYSLLNRMVQPVFRGGQIRAQIDASKARYAELAANYTTTILGAMQEVEDALAGEMYLQQQLDHAQKRLVEAKAAEQLSRQRYERGVESILTVLESERRSRLAEETLALLKGQIWTTRVNLHLAVGGDWDEPDQETTDDGSKDESQ